MAKQKVKKVTKREKPISLHPFLFKDVVKGLGQVKRKKKKKKK